MNYHFSKKTTASFQEAISDIRAALQNEGFGIISEIDLKEKFKEKLQVDFRNYTILGACNPKLAYQAIGQDDKIGVMLPCNVLVQEHEGGGVEVTAINPLETMATASNANLEALAQEVNDRLHKAVASLR